MSVVFDFNDSLNEVAPEFPILLSVDVKGNEKSFCWWMSLVCLLFFCLHHSDRVQWVLCLISIVYSMILLLFLQCYLLMRREMTKELFVDGCLLCISFFCLHNSDRVQLVLCLISMIHSMILLLCLQSSCLLMRSERRVNCWWMSFLCLLSFVFTTQIECSECCVWFQWFTQWCCSWVSNSIPCWHEEKWRVNCWWMSFVFFLSSRLR